VATKTATMTNNDLRLLAQGLLGVGLVCLSIALALLNDDDE